MDPELHKEWRAVEDEAFAVLRACGEGEPGFLVDARVLILPSFEDCRAYALLRSVRDEAASHKGYRRIWRKQIDFRKFESPVARVKHLRPLRPTIETQKVQLAAPAVRSVLEQVRQSRVPPCTLERKVGTDGTSHEVMFGRFFISSEFRWWESPPDGWQSLEQFVAAVQALIDQSMGGAG